ncbi:MAG: 3-carboxy-cis,cis-muconate cycloisomerase, partial [Herbaspirillum sp.]
MGLSDLSGALSATPAMQALFSDSTTLQRMLDFEAALARAEAQHGVIPATAVGPITAACHVANLDQRALALAATKAGNLAIPLVKQLTACVAQHDAEAAKYVHWGATSQDLIDTALVLQLRDALDLIEIELAQLNHALASLASTHQDTLMAGRTWLQQALPISFGLKTAGWLDGLLRHQQRLQQLRTRLFVIQFGGAVGSLASLGSSGLQVTATLAAELGLAVPDTPWHTQRDRVAEAATTLGLLCGSLGKIARDISLQSQTEIGELNEPIAAGRGGSSSMPHKHNPVGCAVTLAAALRVPNLVATLLTAMVQEHERALGGWQ